MRASDCQVFMLSHYALRHIQYLYLLSREIVITHNLHAILISLFPLTAYCIGKFKKTPGPKNKRRSLASAVEGRCGVMVGPRLELRMRSRGGRDSVVTSLVWHHKVRMRVTLT